MLRSIAMLAVLAALFLQVGCSGAGSSTRSGNTYRETLGSTSRAQLIDTVQKLLLTKFQYRTERLQNTQEDIYVETRWRDEITLDDEKAEGYSFVRTRVFINARPRNRTPGVQATYSVTFRAEYLARTQAGDWMEVPITAMRKDELKDIARQMKTEMTSGLRRI